MPRAHSAVYAPSPIVERGRRSASLQEQVRELDLPRTQRDVLSVLAWYGDQYGYIYPGVPALARHTRLSVRTVQRALAQLEAAEIIGPRGKGGAHKATTQYQLWLDQAPRLPRFLHDPEREDGAALAPFLDRTGDILSPVRSDSNRRGVTGDIVSPVGRHDVTRGVTDCHPTGDNLSPNLETKPGKDSEKEEVTEAARARAAAPSGATDIPPSGVHDEASETTNGERAPDRGHADAGQLVADVPQAIQQTAESQQSEGVGVSIGRAPPDSERARELWARVLGELEGQVNTANLEYLARMQAMMLVGDELSVAVPDAFMLPVIELQLLRRITGAVYDVLGRPCSVRLVVAPPKPAEPVPYLARTG